ncbi:DUF4132 domain-containing protein [Glycomyces sp. TRM65418]|uniref:DUF4132 domain-containing protein n=1 Tax=Glycomyces sp. TRM65418 TaxID=2867006 RepID=UPI001CE505ED|nr:DUF4132 domain-containing protein [Glycomyces sp. TRM65418]MCC3762883.1 DUF4132 domain-containing protein [Glycomyces sp. TRM65418]QZD56909.1 DUF4132 domain-containing protein [Glycomyces sp. TRM65418]
MNRADTTPIDEDAVDFPEDWAAYRLDRRGRHAPRPYEADPAAPERLRSLFAAAGAELDLRLQRLDPARAASIRAAIAGEPDPFGAASAATMANGIVHGHWRPDGDRTASDAWIAAHGVAFAAAATIERHAHSVYWHVQEPPDSALVTIKVVPVRQFLHMTGTIERIAPMRSLLAALPDAEYAEVRAAVARHRTSDTHRFLSAMLMPGEDDWVLDACRIQSTTWPRESFWAVPTRAEHLELAGIRRLDPYYCGVAAVARLVDALGPEALPILVNTLEQGSRPDAADCDRIYDAIGRLPSDAAIAYLLDRMTVPRAVGAARAAVARFPTRALRAIASLVPDASVACRARLAGMARERAEHLHRLNDEDRSRIEGLLPAARRPVASPDAVPRVFTAPPWARFGKPSAKTAVTGLVPPPIDDLRWAPGEREEWSSSEGMYANWEHYGVWERFLKRGLGPTDYYFVPTLAFAPEERARPLYDRWDGTLREASLAAVKALIVRYDDAAAKLLPLVKKRPGYRPALLPFIDRDIARIAADSLARSRTHRAFARAWLDRHAPDAAALLVPDAVGKPGKARQSAVAALRHLAETDRSLVESTAAGYGDAAAKAVAALLDADPLDPQLPRLPKPPAWADIAMLPPLLLPGREAALPDEAVRTLLTALAIDDFDRPYPGVDLLAAECDPASLADFSWALFELWLSAGSPTKDGWAMDQLRRFADEDAVRRLTALIREWPGQNQSRKASRALEILGAIGTETALRGVQDISRTSKFKGLKQTATEQIEVIAERLELDADRLADRLVPDFGLGGEQALALDYGPRSFTIKFDERLRPYVIDEQGKRRAGPPKPGANDDPELAQAAYGRFAELRRDIKTTSEAQVKRLEEAMIAGRTWAFGEFRRHLVDHPLVWQLSSRLVWQAETGAERRVFRLAEDRTLADADDEPLAPPEDAVVRLAHPVLLGEKEVEAWASVFADYEILQPFDQLARPVFTLTDEDRATGRVARFEGAKAGAGALIGLIKRGWRYGDPRPGRRYGNCLYFTFPEGGFVLLDPNPSVHPGDYRPQGECVLETVACALPEGASIDPVRLSETLNAVAKLTRTA